MIERPRLRPIESIIVPDERFGRALMLRDTEGVTAAVAVIPAPLVAIVARFDGRSTVREIAAAAAEDVGAPVGVELVTKLVAELDDALLLDSPRYRAERRRVEAEFAAASVRPASHAGGAYHAEPGELRAYLDEKCLAAASPSPDALPADGAGTPTSRRASGRRPAKRRVARDGGVDSVVGVDGNGHLAAVRALIAPHIDPWRGAVGYGHAYNALSRGLAPEVDTFVLLGTSHAPMKEPFALCRKSFATPLGALKADLGAIDAVAEACPFDPYTDVFNHKREHSIEFQAVFVRHLVGERAVRIVPVLCGIGESQRTGRDPASDERAEAFVSALAEVCAKKGAGRVVVVAGADLAHVGPRFGDPRPYGGAQRRALEKTDRESLELATRGDGAGFFGQVHADLETRRVCGLGPIYTLLRLLPEGVRGELLHYEQTVDPEEGSIVSHAAAVFRG